MLARLDAARCASWHQGQVGTRVADKIILDITVVKTHCAEVALAAFVCLAVLASRRFGLRRFGQEVGVVILHHVQRRIDVHPVCVEAFLCEPTDPLRSRRTIPSPPKSETGVEDMRSQLLHGKVHSALHLSQVVLEAVPVLGE